MKKEISGFNTHRLKRDDDYYKLECAFHDEANKHIGYNSNFLSNIVYHRESYLTDHEEKIVMSVIQWLGTPVGQGLLKSVEENVKKESI